MIHTRIHGVSSVSSNASPIRPKLLAAFLLLALACTACARPGSASQAQPSAESEGGPAASAANAAAAAEGEEPAQRTRPLSLQAAAVSTQKPAVVQAAASLAGHDRFLVLGDGPRIAAADFLIATLSTIGTDERLTPFALLSEGMAKQELDPKAFASASWLISSLVYKEAYAKAKAIKELRLGTPRDSGGGLALRFRLLGDEVSAVGEAILYSNAEGLWLIEHFELDRNALSLPRQRFERWEPPLALNL